MTINILLLYFFITSIYKFYKINGSNRQNKTYLETLTCFQFNTLVAYSLILRNKLKVDFFLFFYKKCIKKQRGSMTQNKLKS